MLDYPKKLILQMHASMLSKYEDAQPKSYLIGIFIAVIKTRISQNAVNFLPRLFDRVSNVEPAAHFRSGFC